MAEAYRIAIGLSLTNRVSPALGLIARDFIKTDAAAAALQSRLRGIKLQAALGAGMVATGFFGLDLLSKTLPDAREYAHQLNIMNMAGLSHVEIAQAVGAAWKNTSTVITTTATENLKSLLDLRNVLGSMPAAQWALPIVSKIGAVMGSSSESAISGNAQDIAFTMAKALDIIGAARDPATFAREAGLMSKVVTAFQNRVSPKQFQSVFQYARQAKFDLSDKFKYEFLPTLMLEMGGGNGGGGGSRGVGPMLAAIYRVTNQGLINKKSLGLWEDLGLVKRGAALKTSTTGTVADPLKDAALAANNPFLWALQKMEPAIKAKFGQNITAGQERSVIGQMFRGNQLAASAMMEFISKPQNFLRDQRIIRGAMPYDKAYDQAKKNDPEFQFAALHAQWNNVLTKLGITILPTVISLTQTLNEALTRLIPWMDRNKGLVKDLVLGFAGLSAAMAFGGSVLLLKAGFQGLGLLFSFGGTLLKCVTGLSIALESGTAGAGLAGSATAAAAAIAPLVAGLVTLGGLAAGFDILRHLPTFLGGKADPSWQWFQKHELGGRSLTDVIAGRNGHGLSFAAPKNPRNEFERQEVSAKKRNDDLIHEIKDGLHSLAEAFEKWSGMTVVMDNKAVGRIVSKQQAKDAGGPAGRSPAPFNSRLSPAQP